MSPPIIQFVIINVFKNRWALTFLKFSNETSPNTIMSVISKWSKSAFKKISSHLIFSCFIWNWVAGQQPKQRCPDFPLPRHILQLLGEYSEVLPGQPRDTVQSWVFLDLLLVGHSWNTSRGHSKRMLKPPQLTPLDAKEQWLYLELLPL